MAHYSRRHYERLRNGGPDTPEAVAERRAHRAAYEQASREYDERYPPGAITSTEEALAAAAWLERRKQELLSEQQPPRKGD